jgi:dihydropteroate synthase
MKSASLAGNNSLLEAEIIIDCLTKKREQFSRLDMSSSHLMGVINLTPDSFFKESQTKNALSVSNMACQMFNDGASIVDLGGESSRPGSTRISPAQELERVLPSIIEIQKIKDLNINLSLDTRNLSTMVKGFDNGVDIINDISSFSNEKKISFISKENIPVILMHMQKEPDVMQLKPTYKFAPIDIYKFLSKKIHSLMKSGVKKSNIVIDPGIGFGKTLEHNLEILNYLPLLHCLGVPILLGLSRKSLIADLSIEKFKSHSFKKKILNPGNRLSGSIAFAIQGYNNGIQILRTHDVFETKQAFLCQETVY